MSKIVLLFALIFILTVVKCTAEEYVLDPEAMRNMGYFNLQQQVMINKMLLKNHEDYMKELHTKELLDPRFKKFAGNYHERTRYTSMVEYLISYVALGEQILKEKASKGRFDMLHEDEMELSDTEFEAVLDWI